MTSYMKETEWALIYHIGTILKVYQHSTRSTSSITYFVDRQTRRRKLARAPHPFRTSPHPFTNPFLNYPPDLPACLPTLHLALPTTTNTFPPEATGLLFPVRPSLPPSPAPSPPALLQPSNISGRTDAPLPAPKMKSTKVTLAGKSSCGERKPQHAN